jgi:hypothetical protein
LFGFSGDKWDHIIEIEDSVEIIEANDFNCYESLREIIFSSSNHLSAIGGFQKCTSLCRIEIPSSVETIGNGGFRECTSLNEIYFSSDSHLREIDGFQQCTSLCQIEIPSSIETIGSGGFRGCTPLRVVIIRTGCQMRENKRIRNIKPFLVYDVYDVKKCRRLVHLAIRRK